MDISSTYCRRKKRKWNKLLFFFENAGELRFIVLKRKGGPQHDPHSYGDKIWVRQLHRLKTFPHTGTKNEINYWYSHMTNSGGVRLKWISARKKILPSYQRMIKHMISRLNYESPVHSSFTHTLKKRGKSQNSSLISSSPCIKSSEFQQANIKDWYSGLVRPNNIKYSLKLNFQ
jgi:hypothetical protein